MSDKTILITSALPYVNNIPHLGNIIGSTLSGDVYARYKRKLGENVLYLCGSDMYGTTSEIKARQEGISCQELCDKYDKIHKGIYDWFNIDFDIWGKTVTPEQTELSHEIFMTLYKHGYIEEKELEQMYCTTCQLYLADRYLKGKCYYSPCIFRDVETNGDQCDSCGNLIDISKLKNPYCGLCKKVPELRICKHLFLKMKDLEGALKTFSNEIKMTGNAESITRAWLSNGLISRCITRDLKWGTIVPDIPELEAYKNKVFYVWFDAPIGYYSILKHGRDDWKTWLKKGTKWVQFMGKDNVPFHTLIFPGCVIGSGLDLPLVSEISCTEYLNFEGQKFSKSKGIGIFGDQVSKISETVDINEDYWRYYLMKIRPEKHDTNFSIDEFCTICTADLVKNYGNFVNRCFSMTKKYCSGHVFRNPFDYAQINKYEKEYHEAMNDIRLKDGLTLAIDLSDYGNKYLQNMAPWKEENKDKREDILLYGLWIAFVATEMLEPFIPRTTKMILECFTVKETYIALNLDNYRLPFKTIKKEDIIL